MSLGSHRFQSPGNVWLSMICRNENGNLHPPMPVANFNHAKLRDIPSLKEIGAA
jgi:hypothetical protein